MIEPLTLGKIIYGTKKKDDLADCFYKVCIIY